MKNYSILSPLYTSFYSAAAYRNANRQSNKVIFLYLLGLTTLCCLALTIKMAIEFSRFESEIAPVAIAQIPDITIANGAASVPIQTPHFIQYPKMGETVAIIDMTGQTPSLEGSSAYALLTKKQFFIRLGASGIKTYNLSTVKNLYITGSSLFNWLKIMDNWASIIFLFFDSYFL